MGWLKALPAEVLHFRPMISVHFAGALLQSGELEGVDALLRNAEQWLETMANTTNSGPSAAPTGENPLGAVVVDPDNFAAYPVGSPFIGPDMPWCGAMWWTP